MKFEDIIEDIKKLVGKRLQSVKAGAEITITRVNSIDKQIELVGSNGVIKIRPFEEIRKIWDRLCIEPAVHVDAALGGSGSSRNQPETILANLPYIEVVYIEARKHLTVVAGSTHSLGSIKKMDPVAAYALIQKIAEAKKAKPLPSLIIVTDDLRSVSTSLEGISGVPPQAPSPGIYIHNFGEKQILIVGSVNVQPPIFAGSYIPIDTKIKPADGSPARIAGEDYTLIVRNGINLLTRSFW